MQEKTQDAMTYVRKYSEPDLFITFMCNPSWSEIKAELMETQIPQDRHDLLARVFYLKLKKPMEFLNKGGIFGSTCCYNYMWDKQSKKWKRRIQGTQVIEQVGIKLGDTLGRVYTLHPNDFECFCLHFLLHIVKGPTSF